ncbi:MAG: LPXTG cell wall anchor domain-containing protein [Oscillospiraceae bacterium]|jgi:LPXTG-motif cell wall-anchored protein|nr:LPXTG cell wall anchor domain-containing protein [Oscillospiraceae bacterium]
MTPKTIVAIILVGVIIAGFIFLQLRKKKKEQ